MMNVSVESNQTASFHCSDPSVVLTIPKEYNTEYLVSAVFNTVFCILAVVGNAIILIALPKLSSSLHPPSKALLGSLALSDLAVGLIAQPVFVAYIVGGLVGSAAVRCHARIVFGLASDYLVGVSYLTMTAISLDRFLALRLRIKYRTVVTFRRTMGCLMISWLLCGIFPLIHVLSAKIALVLTTLFLLLFLVLSSIFNFKIYRALHQHDVQVNDQLHRENAINLSRYRKTLGMVVVVYCAHLLCYLPSTGVTIAIIICGKKASLMMIANFLGTLLLFNSALNPFLYCWRVRAVRGTAFLMLGLGKCSVFGQSGQSTCTLDEPVTNALTFRSSGVRH